MILGNESAPGHPPGGMRTDLYASFLKLLFPNLKHARLPAFGRGRRIQSLRALRRAALRAVWSVVFWSWGVLEGALGGPACGTYHNQNASTATRTHLSQPGPFPGTHLSQPARQHNSKSMDFHIGFRRGCPVSKRFRNWNGRVVVVDAFGRSKTTFFLSL